MGGRGACQEPNVEGDSMIGAVKSLTTPYGTVLYVVTHGTGKLCGACCRRLYCTVPYLVSFGVTKIWGRKVAAEPTFR